jgi:small conductance mechanosensitive channel
VIVREYFELITEFWHYVAAGPWAGLLTAMIIFIIGSIGARAASRAVRRVGLRSRVADPTLVPVFSSLIRWTIWILSVIAALDAFGVETRSFLAFLGAAGIGVGLALKETLGDIAAGIVLLVLRPFDVGDSVDIAGVGGDVESIDFFETILRSYDGVTISLPNNRVRQGNIVNYSRAKRRRVDITVSIGYGEDVHKAVTSIRSMLAADPRVLLDPAPLVDVNDLTETSVKVLARFWTPPANFFSTKLELTARVKEALDEAGVQIQVLPREIRALAASAPAME